MKPYAPTTIKHHIAFDIETTIRHDGELFKATPHDPRNLIVCAGFGEVAADGNGDDWKYRVWDVAGAELHLRFPPEMATEPVLLIGANLAFDLSYLMTRYPSSWSCLKKNVHIWDIQQAEYLLTGQHHLYPSLDDMCRKYGFDTKDEKIKEYWSAGVDTTEIPKDELHAYLQHDVEATYQVYLAQMEQFNRNPRLLNLAQIKMDDILFTTWMEVSGMSFDIEKAGELAGEARKEWLILRNHIVAAAHKFGWRGEWGEFNPGSGPQLGALLFGGDVKFIVDEEQLDEEGAPIRYKSGLRAGQIKTKKVEKAGACAGLVKGKGTTTPSGQWKTDDESLTALLGTPAEELVQWVLEWKGIGKDISTYYEGYARLAFNERLHPRLNHCSTATGRMSCASPNIQNVSRKEED